MPDIILSEHLWEKIASFLPKYELAKSGGRPRLPLKQVLEGIIFVKANKIPWSQAPEVFGSKTTLNDYYREWAAHGCFHALKQAGHLFSDELLNVDFDWERIERYYRKSPSCSFLLYIT